MESFLQWDAIQTNDLLLAGWEVSFASLQGITGKL